MRTPNHKAGQRLLNHPQGLAPHPVSTLLPKGPGSQSCYRLCQALGWVDSRRQVGKKALPSDVQNDPKLNFIPSDLSCCHIQGKFK